jgi:hypothetical protein
MIVRISGTGQFELDEGAVRRLDELDTALTSALDANNETEFLELLRTTVQFVRETGAPVPDDTVRPSEVIIPPDDVSLEEARGFFTDEGLMAPLPA